MRADLGRLAASAKGLQVGPPVARLTACNGPRAARNPTGSANVREFSHDHSPRRRTGRASGRAVATGVGAGAEYEPDAGIAEQDAGREGSRGGPRKGVPGLIEENPGR